MVKLTVLYGQPTDAAEFERHYAEVHIPLAMKMQGPVKVEVSKVIGTPDGSDPAFYRMAELYFNDGDHMQQVMATPEAQATVGDLPNFATGGVTLLVSDVQ